MILTGTEIIHAVNEKMIEITPFEKNFINPNSYDLSLGNELFCYEDNVVLDSKQDNNLKKTVLDENGYVLEKNKLYIAFSKENLKVDNLVPILHSKSGLARLGLFSHITADLLSYDYCGRVMFQLYSSLNVHIYPGMPIGQVSFWKIL